MEFLFYSESGRATLAGAPAVDLALSSAFVSATLEKAIAEIAAEFDAARREREFLFEESPEWQKLTGKMLAFARATALLQTKKTGLTRDLHTPE